MSSNSQEENNRHDVEVNRDVAAFSYFLILSPVILFTRKDSSFIQFHARQACALFVLLIIIAQFPQPISYLNFLTVALAITGIFQANLGNRWKLPIVSQMIEAGFSVDAVWRFLVRIYDTIRRSFVRADHLPPLKKEAKLAFDEAKIGDLQPLKDLIAKEQAARDSQESRLKELEKAFLKQCCLTGKPLHELSHETRKTLGEFIHKLTPLYTEDHKSDDKVTARSFTGKKGTPDLLLGNFDEDSFTLYLLAPLDHAELKFGEYCGKTLKFDDEKTQEKVISELQKHVKTNVKTAPDFPESAPE